MATQRRKSDGMSTRTAADGGATVKRNKADDVDVDVEEKADMPTDTDDIDLDAEAKADDLPPDDLPPDDTMAKADAPFGPPADDELPHGAQAMTEVYDALMALTPVVQKWLDKQENPNVTKFLTDMAEMVDEQCAAISDTYSAEYPEAPPLSDEKVGADDSTTEESELKGNGAGYEEDEEGGIKAEGDEYDIQKGNGAGYEEDEEGGIKAEGDEYDVQKGNGAGYEEDEEGGIKRAEGSEYDVQKTDSESDPHTLAASKRMPRGKAIGPAQKRLATRLARDADARRLRFKTWMQKVAASVKAKRLTKASANSVNEAAEHLDEVAAAETLTKTMRHACKYHSGELRNLTKAAEEMPPDDVAGGDAPPPPSPDDPHADVTASADDEEMDVKSRRRRKSINGFSTKADFDAAVNAAVARETKKIAAQAGEMMGEMRQQVRRMGTEIRKLKQGV